MINVTVIKSGGDWQISSQAMMGVVIMEGSQTREMSPNNNSLHERAAPNVFGDDIVGSALKDAEGWIKSQLITVPAWNKLKA